MSLRPYGRAGNEVAFGGREGSEEVRCPTTTTHLEDTLSHLVARLWLRQQVKDGVC